MPVLSGNRRRAFVVPKKAAGKHEHSPCFSRRVPSGTYPFNDRCPCTGEGLMADDQEMQTARDAIGRRLATHIVVERDLPDQLKALLRELKRQDEQTARIEHGNR